MNDQVRGTANRGTGQAVGQGRVVSSNVSKENQWLVATVEIIGHASPRWRSSKDGNSADTNNAKLAEARAHSVQTSMKAHLKELLPGKDIQFDVNATIADPIETQADINVGTRSEGSTTTLQEAGARGRKANDQEMRRVNLSVHLSYAIDTEVEDEIVTPTVVSGNTKNWKLRVIGETGVTAGGKVSLGVVMIYNDRLKSDAKYFTEGGGGGLSVGVQIVRTSLQWTEFETPEAMSFSDFSGARFTTFASSVGLGLGYELSSFTFLSFINGQKTPPTFGSSGFVAGGIEASIGHSLIGSMYLLGSPRQTFVKNVTSKAYRQFRSKMAEKLTHVVLFRTESWDIDPAEDGRLGAFLAAVAQPFRGS